MTPINKAFPLRPVTSPDSVSLGQFGADLISNAMLGSLEGEWAAITALVTATFTDLCSKSIIPDNDESGILAIGYPLQTVVGFTIPAGVTIYGRFTKITVTAGIVIAYRASIAT